MIIPPESAIDLHEHSPLALAFVGDGVLELLVRARLVAGSRLPPGQLHRRAVRMVSAAGQAAALEEIEPQLTETELAVLRRGGNANKATASKNASVAQYRASTGLETLLGWHYLQGNLARLQQLFEVIWARYRRECDADAPDKGV